MNLWAKRIGQLTLLAVALFFLSCEDETSILGFKNPNEKFDIRYVDIPITSSTLLIDSVRSSNNFTSNDFNRLLVGHYIDPVFGEITSSSYFQYVPSNKINVDEKHLDTISYVYDSASLFLGFDYYAYGSDGNTSQTINIHELTEVLNSSYNVSVNGSVGGQQKPVETIYKQVNDYYTKSNINYKAEVLATATFDVDLEDWNFDLNSSSKATRYLEMDLPEEFAYRIYDRALDGDSTFTWQNIFTKDFPGLAIVPVDGDKIYGFSPSDDSTVIRIHYHSIRKKNGTTKDTLTLSMSLNRIGYNKIVADRTGSELASLNSFYSPSEDGSTRYIQSGTGVVTKLDFSKFLDFVDTIDRIAINSAELKISNINIPSEYQYLPPSNLVVKVIKPNNRFSKVVYPGRGSDASKQIESLNSLKGYVGFDSRNQLYREASDGSLYASSAPFDSTLNIVNDGGTFFTLNYSKDNKEYKGSANLFFQQLFNNKDAEELPYTSVILLPYVPTTTTTLPYGRHVYGKNVDRVSFQKENILLRVYYTVPTTN